MDDDERHVLHTKTVRATPLLEDIPKVLTLCSPVRNIVPWTRDVNPEECPAAFGDTNYSDNSSPNCPVVSVFLPFSVPQQVLVLKCTEDGRGTKLRMPHACLVRTADEEGATARLPRLSPKLVSRDKRSVCGVAATCRNALLFFDAVTAPPFFDKIPLVLHMRAVLLDESVLGAGYSIGACLLQLGQFCSAFNDPTRGMTATFLNNHEGTTMHIAKDTQPRHDMPCYLVTEWYADVCEPRAFGSPFPWVARSVLDDLAWRGSPDGSTAVLDSAVHGFWHVQDAALTRPTQAFSIPVPFALDVLPVHGADYATDKTMIINTERGSAHPDHASRLHVIFNAARVVTIVDRLCDWDLQGTLLAAQGVRGPRAMIETYGTLLGRALVNAKQNPKPVVFQDHLDIVSSLDKVKKISQGHLDGVIIKYVTAWLFLSLIPDHERFIALTRTRPMVYAQLVRAFTEIGRTADSNDPSDQPHFDPTRYTHLWLDFLQHHSVGGIVFPWRNGFTLDALGVDLWTAVAETMASLVALFPPDVLVGLGVMEARAAGEADDVFMQRANEAVVRFRDHPEFRYQRMAIEFYTDKLVDRTRAASRDAQAATEAAVIGHLNANWNEENLLDPEALVDDAEGNDGGNTKKPGGVAPKRNDSAYYAMRGHHGTGHLYALVRATETPFDSDWGQYLQWLLQESPPLTLAKPDANADDNGEDTERASPDARMLKSRSPLHVARAAPTESITGDAYRITSVTDAAAMLFVAREMEACRDRAQEEHTNYGQDERNVTTLSGFLANRKRQLDNRKLQHATSSNSQEAHYRDTMSLSAYVAQTTFEGPGGHLIKLALSPEQRHVILSLEKHWFTFLTGGAGTGKSTLIATIMLRYMTSNDWALITNDTDFKVGLWLNEASVVLLTAYGTPASNFTTDYGVPAVTIHYASAVLNQNYWNDDRCTQKRTSSNSQARVAIVDEASVTTLDHYVMLFNAFPRLEKLIVVGDMNQMHAIDRGNMGDALVAAFGARPGIVHRLSYNYRLQHGPEAAANLEQRTHRVFDAVLAGSVLANKEAYGLYRDDVPPGQLPGMCYLADWSDMARTKRALAACPVLIVSHVSMDRGIEASLTATCNRLVDLFGTRPVDWLHVQILTQRNEEVTNITFAVTRRLFPTIPVKTWGKHDTYDLFVGERAVFNKRTRAFAADGRQLFIYKNAIRTIARIEDAIETRIKVDAPSSQQKNAAKGTERLLFKDKVVRASTQQFIRSDSNVPARRRIVTFTNGQYVVCDYKTREANREIKFMRRGVCATNASMEGLGEDTVVLYIRPEVSHTFDRNELYTALTRMRKRAIVVAAPESFEKVARKAAPPRRSQIHEVLAQISTDWSEDGNEKD